MNDFSIKNISAGIRVNNANDEEALCTELFQAAAKGVDSTTLLKKIDDHLGKLSTDQNKQINFLENAFSCCDIVPPFGTQPVNIIATLDGIRSKIQDLIPNYFALTDKMFEKFNNNEIKHKRSVDNIIPSRILTFSTGQKYEIQSTRGAVNNCLIDAITKGSKSNINRCEIFTKENIENQLKLMMSVNRKSGYITDEEEFLNLKQMVISIYNEVSDVLESSTDISQLAVALLNHINTSNCFLDAQLAAPIIAMKFNQNIVIITPNHENTSGLAYHIIDNKGNILHDGELSNEKLSDIENNPNNLFIYNGCDVHFEWLKRMV